MATIIEAPRPDDEKHWFESDDLPLRFRECDTCASKSGTPILCKGCLHNRAVIGRLNTMIGRAAPPELQDACLMLLGAAYLGEGLVVPVMFKTHLEAIADILRKVRVPE
jgi:hypothetical protein